MPIIEFNQQQYRLFDGDNLLQSLLDAGIKLPYGCRGGVCQACMLQAVSGQPERNAQLGLTAEQKQQGYLLACQCHPKGDMRLQLPASACRFPARKLETQWLTDDILRLRLSCPIPFSPGQSLMIEFQGRRRRYSIASVPPHQPYLEFHIEQRSSSNFCKQLDALPTDTVLTISLANGDCRYQLRHEPHPLLLIGHHTGLAPLYGLLQHALQQGHQQPIELIHLSPSGQSYLGEPLRQLSQRHSNLSVQQLTINDNANDAVNALLSGRTLSEHYTFVAGAKQTVEPLAALLFRHGVKRQRLHVEGFSRS